jgi:branched-chain amino acid transport system permease protein
MEQLLQNPNFRRARNLVLALILALLPFIIQHGFGSHGNTWLRNLDFAMLYIMLALGLNIVVGYAGLLDLGYIAFYAVGAYTYALMNSPHLAHMLAGTSFEWVSHAPLWFVLPLCALMAGCFGMILGAPTLKLRGDYLAIVTLGFGEIIRLFLNNLDRPINITNGPQGINLIEPVSILGHKFSESLTVFGIEFQKIHLYYYLFLALSLLIILVTTRLQMSRIGRAWVAIREDEIAAQAMGINTRNVKLLAFAMGASFGGVSGAMFASFQGFVSPESFVLMESIVVLSMVVLGGMGNIPGVILGAVILFLTPEVLRDVVNPMQDKLIEMHVIADKIVNPENLRMLLFALALIFVMLVRPEGLWPSKVRRAEFHEDDKADKETEEKEAANG